MKVTLNWLKQYVEFDWSPDELAERLTMLGLEVEGLQKLGGEFAGIIVAQILSSEKHPNADKLSVCLVNDGKGERQIVCGAKNYQVGDKVPLILPGQTLPAKPGEPPFTIKVGKIRGVESHGMLCSPKELGMAADADGLLILAPDAVVGQPLAEHLGRAGVDAVYDLEITPNRADLNGVIGIAREISALTGHPLRLPPVPTGGPTSTSAPNAPPQDVRDGVEPAPPKAEALVSVRIEAPDLCARYVARVVLGVRIGPSPAWLKSTLEKVGIRSISNLVDVTNYVMMETGQPLHAFDYHLLSRSRRCESADGSNGNPAPSHHVGGIPTIVVRHAHEGEPFTTLDGQARTLTPQMLLIADETRAIALAGIMGGQNTEINERTVDVLIESAHFEPANIRRTSRALALRTESSYRFERGADIGITDWASARAAQLILETAGGRLAPGAVDAFPRPPAPKQISLRHHKVGELLGVDIPLEQQVNLLGRLGLALQSAIRNPQSTVFTIPTFRVDLKREVDLIEEIARLHGVDRIPATPPRGAVGSNAYDAVHDQLAEARRLLTGLGLCEAQGQTLILDASAKWVAAETPSRQVVELQNPLSNDMNALRPSLIAGMLEALRHNLHHQTNDVALFEIGRVFFHVGGQPREERHVAIALTGRRHAPFWSGVERDARFDLSDLKGVLEEFLEHFGVRGSASIRRKDGASIYLESATVMLGAKQVLGEWGQLSPRVARRYDLREAVLIAELNLDLLLANRNSSRTFKPLPAYPSIRRDVAMIVPETTTHEAVLNVVRQARPQHLASLELFDVFRGQNVPAGHRSVAYAFTYRHAERTLTDAEVNAEHDKLVEQFKRTLQAQVRA